MNNRNKRGPMSIANNKFQESEIDLKEPYKQKDLNQLRNFFRTKVDLFYNI